MLIEKRCMPPYGNVIYLTDGNTQLAAALDYGLRVVHFSLAGKESIFYRQDQSCTDGIKTEKGWRLYGGHRLWAAPESDLSYYPDNDPVSCEILSDGVILTQNTDPWTGLQKELTITYLPDGAVSVKHSLLNCGTDPVKVSAWGISSLRGGGRAVLPFAPTETGETSPRRTIALWGGTRPDDPRIHYKNDRIEITCDPENTGYCKIGIYNKTGEASYSVGGQNFIISFAAHEASSYPDFGCNTEVFVHSRFLELESLGSLQEIKPGERTVHTEIWRLTHQV